MLFDGGVFAKIWVSAGGCHSLRMNTLKDLSKHGICEIRFINKHYPDHRALDSVLSLLRVDSLFDVVAERRTLTGQHLPINKHQVTVFQIIKMGQFHTQCALA